MAETKNNDKQFPEVKPTKPGNDTAYIAPIIGKLGYDTRRPWLFGLGTSPNNGVDFHVFLSFDGLNFDDNDIDKIWNGGTADKVKKEVDSATAEIPAAVSAANSAVSAAESAVAASKVNSDAIVAQSEAISEAKAAMDSATAEIQQTAANAASDAAKIRADVAQVQSEVDTAKAANSASVEALKSDVSAAKQDLADVHDSLTKAQAAAEQNQKAINQSIAQINSDVDGTKQDLAGVRKDLTKAQADITANQKSINDNVAQINADITQDRKDIADVRQGLTKAQSDITANQKAVNDNVAQINSNIEQDRKDIASAQQANADTAKQLDTYSKQAQEQGRTIKAVQDKQDGFSITLADVQGNVSQVSDKVSGLSASLKDAQDNVASVKAQADQLSATLTDHSKSIATLTASAKELSSTLEDADGRLSKVEQTAQTNSSTLSDLQGDLSQVKQDATTLTATLKDAQGNISTLQQKADSLSTQLASAQGDIATLQTGIDGVKAILTSHDKSIHTLQADSKSLKDSMVNAQGDISTLQKSATSLDSEMKDHAGRLSKVEQNAATQATTLSDLQGNLTQVKQQADGLVTTLKDAQGSITQIQQKADGTLAQLKSAQGDIASLQTDVTGIKATLTSHEGDIHTLQADSKTLKDDMQDAQGNISSLQKSSTKLDSEMSSQDGRLSKVEQTAKEHTSTISDLGKKVDSNGGGVNLLTNTQLFDYNWSWDQIGHSFASGVLTLDGNADATSRMLQQLTDNDITGKTFSVSFNARICADCDSTSVEVDAGPYDATKRINIASKDFQRYKVENWQWNSSSIFFSFYVKNGRIDLTNLKLEYGAVATPYSLAPADLATISQVKQTADGIEATLKNAQGDIDQIKQTAKGTAEQLSNAQGDITALQKDVDGIKLTIADHDKNIHTLQANSKSLRDDMEDAKGNISTLQKTSTSITSELKDHDGRMSKVEQTASTLTNEFSDQQGHLNRVEQTAQGTEQTVANQQGQINSIQTDVSGIHGTITGQGNQIANINVTLSGLNTKYEGVSGDLSNLSNKAMQNRGTVNSPDFNSLTQAGYYTVTLPINGKNYPTGSWGTLEVSGQVSDANGRLNQKYVSDDNGTAYIRQYNASAKLWTAWVKEANQYDVDTLNGKITTNSTQITQNKQAIALKADQSTVDNLSGEVSQNTTQLKVQADQISSKVSSTDFKMLSDKVNNSKVGGRNIALNTDRDIVIDDTGNAGAQGWCFATIPLAQQPKIGDQVTVSAEGTLTGRGDLSSYSAILFNSTHSNGRSNLANLISGKRASVTLTVNNLGGEGDTVLLLYAGKQADTEGKKNVVHHLKVEFGNVATDWTPAPEDLTTAIQKNSTDIDQTNKQISLKADQTEVDQVKQTAMQNSSRLDVMANEISSKVTSTDVNNIVDSKGFTTTNTVQSLITQKAGTINESITNLTSKVNSNGGGVNLLPNSKDLHTGWTADGTSIYPVDDYLAVRATGGLQRLLINPTEDTKGKLLSVSFDACVPSDSKEQDVQIWVGPFQAAIGIVVSGSDFKRYKAENWKWNSVNGALSIQLKNVNDKINIKNIKLEFGPVATPYSPAPSDNATVTQIQQITASIDGLQSTVANKADKSQITQLSNMIQSKVSSSDFNNLRKAVDLQTLDSADINNMKTNGHYFVRNLANNPVGGWVYVDVTGNGNDRIRQDVYQDNGNEHKYRRWVNDHWTNWDEGANYSEITQLRDDINLRVKSGDLLSQINIQAGQTLIQSKKLYLADDSVIFSNKAFIPSAAIVNLDASKLTFYGAGGTYATMGSSVKQYDEDKLKSTINLQYNGGVEVHASNELGSILTMHDDTIRLAVKSQVYGSGSGQPVNQQYSGVWASSNYVLMNSVDSEGNTTGISIGSGGNVNGQYRFVLYDDSKSNVPSYGVKINTQRFNVDAGSTSLYMGPTGTEIRANDYTTLHGNDKSWLEGGHAQLYLHDGVVEMHNVVDGSAAGLHMTVQGWATFSGYVEAMGWTTKSTLSSKTRIEPLNTSDALDKITSTDLTTYQYKDEVSAGSIKRHAGLIIDDVHDVAQYSTPDAFISENRQGRSDADIIGYLMGAVQELKKQLDKVKEQVNNG